MKPREKKPEIVYRIIDKKTGEAQGSYSRAYCDEYDFTSVEQARHANVHGMYDDKHKYKIAKYRVTYELMDDDCDDANDLPLTPPQSDFDVLMGDSMESFLARLSQERQGAIESVMQQMKTGADNAE